MGARVDAAGARLYALGALVLGLQKASGFERQKPSNLFLFLRTNVKNCLRVRRSRVKALKRFLMN